MKLNRMVPFGYQMTEGRVRIHPQESVFVAEVFAGYLTGVSPAKLADRLNTGGIRFSNTSPNWNKCRLYRMLADERYAGEEEYPQIISKEQLAAAKAQIECNRTYRAPEDEIARGISGKMVCACGGTLKRSTKKHWRCQSCGMDTRSADIERSVTAMMARLRRKPKLAAHGKANRYEPTQEILRLSNEIRRSMNGADAGEKELQAKIMRCAAMKYEAFRPDFTEYVTKVLAETPDAQWSEADGIIEIIRKTVSEIIITAPDSLRIRLKNGAVITKEKEESNGNSGD